MRKSKRIWIPKSNSVVLIGLSQKAKSEQLPWYNARISTLHTQGMRRLTPWPHLHRNMLLLPSNVISTLWTYKGDNQYIIFDKLWYQVVCMLSRFSRVWLSAIPWTVAHWALLSMGPPGGILEWVAMPFSRGSSWPRDQTRVSYVSCIGRRVLYH